MLNNRIRLSTPGKHFMRNVRRDDSIPLHSRAGWTGHHPVGAPITQVLDLAHMGHEAREALIVCPEREDALDGGVDGDSLPDIDGASASTHTQHALKFDVGNSAHQHAQTCKAN